MLSFIRWLTPVTVQWISLSLSKAEIPIGQDSRAIRFSCPASNLSCSLAWWALGRRQVICLISNKNNPLEKMQKKKKKIGFTGTLNEDKYSVFDCPEQSWTIGVLLVQVKLEIVFFSSPYHVTGQRLFVNKTSESSNNSMCCPKFIL